METLALNVLSVTESINPKQFEEKLGPNTWLGIPCSSENDKNHGGVGALVLSSLNPFVLEDYRIPK